MTTPADLPILWKPTPRQAVALASAVPDLFFGGARGGGKSDFLLLDWFSHATQQPPVAGILWRRTLPELQEIEARAHALFPRLGLTWVASSREWRHPNGSFLRFRYLESIADASRYQGHQYQWAGGDECGAYPSPDVVDLMRGCLRTTIAGQLCLFRLTGNPGGPGHAWLKARYVTPAPPEVPHLDPVTGLTRIYIPSRLEDNPHIQDKEQYRRNLSAAGAAHLVRAWLHGDWDVLPNGGILRPDAITNTKPPERERMRVYFGIDPAARSRDKTGSSPDFSAIVVVGVDPGRRFHLLEVWRAQTGTLELWKALSRMAHRWQPELIWIEGGPIGAAVMPWFQEAQDRAGTWWSIQEVSHMGDKVGKAQAMAAAIDQGLVSADKTAEWWAAFRDECTVFDGSDDRHDDQVDGAGIVFRGLRMVMAGSPPVVPPVEPPERSRQAMRDRLKAAQDLADRVRRRGNANKPRLTFRR